MRMHLRYIPTAAVSAECAHEHCDDGRHGRAVVNREPVVSSCILIVRIQLYYFH
jgi:hypothetical protein